MTDDDLHWAVVGRVAHGLLHDLNNFLSTITTLSELLLMDAPPDSTAVEDLTEVKESAWLAATTAQKLQLFVADVAGSGGTAEEWTDVAAVTRELEFLLRRLVPSMASLEIDAPLPSYASVSKGAFEEALLALAIQAKDALRSGGTFRVRVTVEPTHDGGALVEVGSVGLAAQDGIGTAAASRLSASVGGRIDLVADGPGHCLRLSLPSHGT